MVSGPVFLRQKTQDWNDLERGALSFPAVEQKSQKELAWMRAKYDDSSFLLKEAGWVI